MKRLAFALLCLPSVASADEPGEWQTIFNGRSLEGWKASENTGSWTVSEGRLKCDGPRSHLFFTGADEPFKNFEFQCEVMTTPGSNAGIYFHTKFQESGWPKKGFEAQINATQKDPKKTYRNRSNDKRRLFWPRIGRVETFTIGSID